MFQHMEGGLQSVRGIVGGTLRQTCVARFFRYYWTDLEHERMVPVAADHGITPLHQHLVAAVPFLPSPGGTDAGTLGRSHMHLAGRWLQKLGRYFSAVA